MRHSKVIVQRLVSPDGRITAEAKSEVIGFNDSESIVSQSVTVKISGSSCSSSSTSSASKK